MQPNVLCKHLKTTSLVAPAQQTQPFPSNCGTTSLTKPLSHAIFSGAPALTPIFQHTNNYMVPNTIGTPTQWPHPVLAPSYTLPPSHARRGGPTESMPGIVALRNTITAAVISTSPKLGQCKFQAPMNCSQYTVNSPRSHPWSILNKLHTNSCAAWNTYLAQHESAYSPPCSMPCNNTHLQQHLNRHMISQRSLGEP